MEDLLLNLQKDLDALKAELNVANPVVDPAWQAVQDALTANGWTAPGEAESPAEDANEPQEEGVQ